MRLGPMIHENDKIKCRSYKHQAAVKVMSHRNILHGFSPKLYLSNKILSSEQKKSSGRLSEGSF